MVDKILINNLVEQWLADNTDYYLVDLQVKPGNIIVVEIDNADGVDIESCSTLSRQIEAGLDREVEDFELEVGSAGITSPFKVLKQYLKNIGNEVEVLTATGKKLTGVLESANEEGIILCTIQKVKRGDLKKKVEEEIHTSYKYEEIKYTKYLIRF